MAEIEVARTLLEDVREFIEEKWKHSACELCDTDKWTLFPEQNAYVYLDIGDEKNTPQNFPSALFLAVSCRNCGNLRLVFKKALDEWRGEQKAKTTK